MRERETGEQSGYFCLKEGKIELVSLRDLVERREEGVWSVRLGTGLIGEVDCKSGNRGPKGINEVLMVQGNEGLKMAIRMGFITCPGCKPERKLNFYEAVEGEVHDMYEMFVDEFIDKRKLGFDTRRVDWETLVPIIGEVPSRIYLPQGLSRTEVEDEVERFEGMERGVPKMGWYDRNIQGGFGVYYDPTSVGR